LSQTESIPEHFF